MRILFSSLALALLAAYPARAAELSVSIEVPKLNVASYHRPYVAAWIERPDQSVAADLAVWYDVDLKDGEGTKWLKDLRQWWRRSGRQQDFPVDGVTGATRPVGSCTLRFDDKNPPLATLPKGEYGLVVEAARELGGRELLRIPFAWPPTQSGHKTINGEHELGAIKLDLAP